MGSLTLLWGEEAVPCPPNLPLPERRPFQGSSLFQMSPDPCSVPASCGLHFSRPQSPLLEKQRTAG